MTMSVSACNRVTLRGCPRLLALRIAHSLINTKNATRGLGRRSDAVELVGRGLPHTRDEGVSHTALTEHVHARPAPDGPERPAEMLLA